jgi:hypothetical protein
VRRTLYKRVHRRHDTFIQAQYLIKTGQLVKTFRIRWLAATDRACGCAHAISTSDEAADGSFGPSRLRRIPSPSLLFYATAISPIKLTGTSLVVGGPFQFGVTNFTGGIFTVLASKSLIT